MKILITGASGFLGKNTAKRLSADGHSIRELVHNDRTAWSLEECIEAFVQEALQGGYFKLQTEVESPVLNEIGNEIFKGNILDLQSLEKAASGVDAVVHLVGIIQERPGTGATFENVHVDGVKNLIAAMKSASVSRLVHVSALGTRENAPSRYHRSKWQAEKLVIESGLQYTILRPSVIFGPGDGFTAKLISLVCGPPVIPVAGGKTKLSPVSVDDVAECIASSLSDSKHINKVYDIAGPESLSVEEIMRIVASAAGVRKPFAKVPALAVLTAALIGERIFRNPPITVDQFIMLSEDNVTNSNAARDVFGLKLKSFRDEAPKFIMKCGC